MVDEQEIEDLEEIISTLENLITNIYSKDLIADIQVELDSYKELYNDKKQDQLEMWQREDRQRDYDFDGGRL